MKSSLFFLSLTVASLCCSAIARRGDLHHSNRSLGYVDEEYSPSARHLLHENSSSITEEEYIQKLEELAQGYMSNSDLEKTMKELNHRCSNISRIYSIGKSVLGVPLWVLEFSDRPGQKEAEPAFKFVGNVHGNEPVGRELLLRLGSWICDNYMNDPLATLIVENVHLHLLPSMNPDGFALRRRGNANNIDLNRDFPDQGALVANYPWDGTEDKKKNYYGCPDDKTFKFLANLYSRSHYNMSQSEEFPGGITNGAFWYPIYGGMQDWNYIHFGCFELTLEISDNKWPNADELPLLWEYNRMSMLNMVASLVKTGIHGRIISSDSERLLPASIAIQGMNQTITAGKRFADYHRLLPPREKYEVIASMPGYRSKMACVVLGEAAAKLDFVLDPDTTHDGDLLQLDSSCFFVNKIAAEVMDFLPWQQLQISTPLILILIFLCFLMKRRVRSKSNNGNHRQMIRA